uniref:Uncharacterized protein n=1 Tax=Plectus sambesii TaxID=2011161 RepID=A0A914VG40_9BILA
MTSSTVTPQQQRQPSNSSSGRDKTHAGFHIANMLPEISPMQHGQQQQPDNRDNPRQEDSSRRQAQQAHASHQYWSADYTLHGFSRPSYEMTSTNPYYRDPSVDDRTNFMPRFNL